MTPSTGTTARAQPLPPEERRAALIAATAPLVVRHGTKVTTRQIAEAAGVAEGTIFRVFPDKESLVKAAIEAVLDPLPTLAELRGVDPGLPLRERMTQAIDILRRRLTSVFDLMSALRMDTPAHHPPQQRPSHQPIVEAVVWLIEPDRDRFRMPPEQVARLMRLITFSGTHPGITDNDPLTTDQIVSVLLDGVLRRPDPDGPPSNTGESC